MAEEQSVEGHSADISVFSPIKAKQEEVYTLKFNFNNDLKKGNFASANGRMDLIRTAYLIRDNDDLLSTVDDEKLMDDIKWMRFFNDQLSLYRQGRDDNVIRDKIFGFSEWAHQYNKDLNTIMRKNGEGSKTKKDSDIVSRLYLALNTPSKFNNMYGIPISPQMEILARALHIRALNEWDNIVNINSNGITGAGKTSFALALATTYVYHMTGLGWDWNYNLVINEDKEYVTQLFSHLPQYQLVQLDEAGNQGNKKTWWDSDQIEFMNYMTRLRVHGITTLVIWPDSKEIDPGLSSGRAAINITINKRGTAIVRGFNRNPYAAKKEYIPYLAKNKVALTGSEAHDIMHEFDMVNLLEIPFYKIPDGIWANYAKRKEDSLKVSALNKRYKKDRFETANDYYTKFFLSITPDKVRITATEVVKFGEDVGYAISFRKVADQLATGTGRRWRDIIKYENAVPGQPLDANVIGYIDIDAYIQQYLDRLRSMKQGAQEAPKL